jgi:hypothetical protein
MKIAPEYLEDVSRRGAREILVEAGLPATRRNRVLYNLSCWVGLLVLFSWLTLLALADWPGRPRRSDLLYYAELPSLLLVPGLLYLMTRRRWPAFALFQKDFLTLVAVLTPLMLPVLILVRVMRR